MDLNRRLYVQIKFVNIKGFRLDSLKRLAGDQVGIAYIEFWPYPANEANRIDQSDEHKGVSIDPVHP
jgi:hypothetical protein